MTIAEEEIENGGQEILYVNFNQDYSCISVGTKSGYRIYNSDPFTKCFSKLEGEYNVVEMLFCTSLVALVNSRNLKILNTKRSTIICELSFQSSILAIKMNRKRLIVVLESQIYVYDISNMKLLNTMNIMSSSSAICSLSPSSENCYLACQSNNIGEVEIYDLIDMKLYCVIQAHKSPISCIQINSDGTLLATASEKGTVIRVFSIQDGNKLYQFRRGSYSAKIYSISFNLVSTLLCVSSDTETVHIFKLYNSMNDSNIADDGSNSENQLTTIQRKSSFQNITSFLPNKLTNIWEPSRHFASLKLPNTGIRSLVALSSTTPQVFVVTLEGYFYLYNIDLDNGGECVLLKRNSLFELNEVL